MCINFYTQALKTALKAAESHLKAVALERTFYRDISKKSHTNLEKYYTVDDTFQPPPFGAISRPMLLPTTIHYSFDMAQQVCSIPFGTLI